ncbi:MAG: DUF1697 domain-containing protein [Thermoleophilaceae bacterium]|nr:DUF1697 domain-containing protein [Thermoleophilaceae bacterium]
MARYAAFLRGVNLGRHRKVSGAELKSCFEEMGFEQAETFRTSGNVVFDAGREPRGKLTDTIEGALAKSLGYEVTVFVRTAQEIEAIAEHEPFPAQLVTASMGKLQVSMLNGKPSAAARKRVLALATEDDRLAFGDRELYWLPSGGIRDSALNGKAIEDLLGPSTMRTMGTVELLAAKYF